jgi:hypothetical protein
MDERGLKPTTFARTVGVKTSTMFSIYRGEVNVGGISIDNFLKIAHGVGMSAEELYYGYVDGEHGNEYSDDRQRDANDVWEHVSEEYRAQMFSHVKTIEKAYRYEIVHTQPTGNL